MRTTNTGGGILGLALACVFPSLVTCKPLTTTGTWPAITTLSPFGSIPAQTVTDTSQTVTYSETITTTTTTVSYSSAGTYIHGCLTTVVPSAGTYTLESPQQIDLISPYYDYNLLNTCPTCPKELIYRECQFGQCDAYLLSLIYVSPSSTQTYELSSSLGAGCTTSLPGGSGGNQLPVTTPTANLPVITINPTGVITTTIGTNVVVINGCAPSGGPGSTPTTQPTLTPISTPPTLPPISTPPISTPPPHSISTITSYFTGSGSPFTTTVGDSCIVFIPYATQIIPLPATASAITIFNSGTEIIGSPVPTPTAPIVYMTTTLYFNGGGSGYTTTVGSSVIINLPYILTTVTLPAGAPGYTTTISGTEIIGSPLPSPSAPTVYVTTTLYFNGGGSGYTTTIGSSVVVNLPYTRTTVTLPPGASGYTSTISGEIIFATPAPYSTVTTYVIGGPGFTSTLPGSGVVVGVPASITTLSLPATARPFTYTQPGGSVIIIGSPGPYVFETLYTTGVAATVTNGGTIIDEIPVSITTVSLPATATPFTSTVSGGSLIIVGSPGPYVYNTVYTAGNGATITNGGTIIAEIPYVTSTSYLDNGGSPFTQTIGGTIVVGIPVGTVTVTTTLSAYQSAYTSTIGASGSVPGTVIIGSPISYTTTTSYINNGGYGYTSTIGGSVIIGVPAPTVTVQTTISAGGQGFTTTIPASGNVPGTVIIETPAPYVYATSFVPNTNGGGVSTITAGGSIIVYIPYTTIWSYFYPSTGGTIATTVTGNSGTVTCLTPYAYTTAYRASPGSAALTTTISGTIVYITEYVTSTNYIYGGSSSYISTIGGTIVYGLPTISLSASISVSIPGITLPTITITSLFGPVSSTATIPASGTAAATVIIVQPTSCSNAGLSLGVYNQNIQLSDNDATYSTFDPAIYKRLIPAYTDTATTPSYSCSSGGTCALTGVTTPISFPAPYKVFDYHGYFIAPFTGTYTISTSNIDDALFLWFSSLAVNGWTRANANLTATYGTYPAFTEQDRSLSVSMTQGNYYPLRLIYVNAQGGGGFTLGISGPAGQTVAFNETNLVRFGCGGNPAPFPLYGLET